MAYIVLNLHKLVDIIEVAMKGGDLGGEKEGQRKNVGMELRWPFYRMEIGKETTRGFAVQDVLNLTLGRRTIVEARQLVFNNPNPLCIG